MQPKLRKDLFNRQDVQDFLEGIFLDIEKDLSRELLYCDLDEIQERRAEAQALDRLKGKYLSRMNESIVEIGA